VRVAVVGHVEWVRFARGTRLPHAGEIVHAQDSWEQAAGGGAVAAVQLARLAGEAELFTALGDDEAGRNAAAELERRGVRVHASWRPEPQRRAFTFTDAGGERTITIMGPRLVPRGADELPWERLSGAGAVYFTGGDGAALHAARRARVLVATARARDALAGAGVVLDALVRSAGDAGERLEPGELDPAPALSVATEGARGGRWTGPGGICGRYEAATVPGPVCDTYGAGDSFAAGLAFALGEGRAAPEALELAARCGAHCVAAHGPYRGQLGLNA